MLIRIKTCYFLVGFFYFFTFPSFAQDQRIADSLAMLYDADTITGKARLEFLMELSFNETNDYQQSLKYAEELIRLSELEGDFTLLSQGYFQKGNAKQSMGDLKEAIVAYFESAEIARRENIISHEGSAYGAIADIYSISDNHKNAMLYYNKAITTLRKTEDTVALASFILNAGDELLKNRNFDLALTYFNESGALFEEANYLTGKAYNLGNIGMVYARIGKNNLAEQNINEAILILIESEDYHPISVYLISMSDIYQDKKEHQTAIDYAHRSLSLAEQYGLREQIADANQKLAELYELIGDLVTSYAHYKSHIAYRDSLLNIEKVQQLADQRTNFEVSQKQVEVELLEQRTRNQLIILAFIGLLLLTSLWFYRTISKEKKKSEKLLLNILPEDTAKELKANGVVKAKKYDAVTVLFTDFKGFTSYSEKLSPEALVETISFYFSKFDAIIEKHGLEKIKTIGDAYMCAGGLHGDTEDHAHSMVQAAFEIAEFVEETKKDEAASELTFDIRIGINSGPVVAGVVGTKKFAYDIWGDTVNVASRMESMSEPGRINISENTYALVAKDFDCVPRGAIQVKNRGMMQMYFVNALKNQTSKTPSVSK